MSSIRQIQALNKRELENAVPPEASWHADYRDTAYIYVGGLPYDLSEGDIITIFSQYGEPVHIHLARDKETGKSRGFAFLKYEDQRSTDLAVDNLCGATVLGRVLRVDHVRYKRREEEGEEDNIPRLMGDLGNAREDVTDEEARRDTTGRRKRLRDAAHEEERRRPKLREEQELEELIRDHDEEDPMKEYLITEKKEEVARALERMRKSSRPSSTKHSEDHDRSRHRHRHHHHHHRRQSERDKSRSRDRSRREVEPRVIEGRSRRERSLSEERKTYRDRSRTPERLRHRR